jgi:lipopolysaccharide export system protein LptA
VFITAETGEFDHQSETALYSGNARGWQENNYVRADKILVRQREGQMRAEGSVQSAIYNAKQKVKERESTVPVFASAQTMSYDRNTRIIRYENAVDMRQGTDRMTSKMTDVYLGEDNALSKSVAEGGVVVTQPGRRATGDWVQYTAADEVAILRGTPAHVDDGENGSSSGSELTMYMREKRVVGEGTSKTNSTGRIRSVYKVKQKP